jgi:hypothetical protein
MMITRWKNARRRALLQEPDDQQLARYTDAYKAGYARGVIDVRRAIPVAEWGTLVRNICIRLASEHSVVEAGCWLTGVHSGRSDALDDARLGIDAVATDVEQQRLTERFCNDWDNGSVADSAMECDPANIRITRVISALCSTGELPQIKKRLTNIMSVRRQISG